MANVLIVEPDAVLARCYAEYLVKQDHKVTVANGAQTAIHACDETSPDIIFLELQLGEHNGIEFLYELRSYSDLKKIPVVILSNIPKQEFEDQKNVKKQINVEQFIYKPSATLSQLKQLVDRYSKQQA